MLPSLQTTAVPPHAPPEHLSGLVQALPSLQPSALLGNTHPDAGLQVSSVQMLPSVQVSSAPGTHTVLAQVSPMVHTLPSLQPTVLAGKEQPVAAMQLSLVQMLPSLQTIGVPEQTPAAHLSGFVQALPSSQPSVLFTV